MTLCLHTDFSHSQMMIVLVFESMRLSQLYINLRQYLGESSNKRSNLVQLQLVRRLFLQGAASLPQLI